MKTRLIAVIGVTEVRFECPHCGKVYGLPPKFRTNSLPTKNECPYCLEPVEFEIMALFTQDASSIIESDSTFTKSRSMVSRGKIKEISVNSKQTKKRLKTKQPKRIPRREVKHTGSKSKKRRP